MDPAKIEKTIESVIKRQAGIIKNYEKTIFKHKMFLFLILIIFKKRVIDCFKFGLDN